MTATDDLNGLPDLATFSAFVASEHSRLCEERKLSIATAINQWIAAAASTNPSEVPAATTIAFTTVCDCESEISTALSAKGYSTTYANGRLTVSL